MHYCDLLCTTVSLCIKSLIPYNSFTLTTFINFSVSLFFSINSAIIVSSATFDKITHALKHGRNRKDSDFVSHISIKL